MTSRLWKPVAHDAGRSVDLVRYTVALVLLTHPLHALFRSNDVVELAAALTSRGLPGALAWLVIAAELSCALGLLVRRFVVPAALVAMVGLVAGIALFYAPNWFVVGGAAEEGHPGCEFNVLLIGCLTGVAWGARFGEARGLEIIRVASALSLIPHGAYAFVMWDVEGMRGWGHAMGELGFPCGVALVWSIKGLELVSAVLRISRRLVVIGCIGNLLVIVPGMWIAHRLHWFVVGPGENGVEFSVVLIAGAVACILAYAPRSSTSLGEPLPTTYRRAPCP